jgi:hypothetical protein
MRRIGLSEAAPTAVVNMHLQSRVGRCCHCERSEAISGGMGVPPGVIPAYADCRGAARCALLSGGSRTAPTRSRIGVRDDE